MKKHIVHYLALSLALLLVLAPSVLANLEVCKAGFPKCGDQEGGSCGTGGHIVFTPVPSLDVYLCTGKDTSGNCGLPDSFTCNIIVHYHGTGNLVTCSGSSTSVPDTYCCTFLDSGTSTNRACGTGIECNPHGTTLPIPDDLAAPAPWGPPWWWELPSKDVTPVDDNGP